MTATEWISERRAAALAAVPSAPRRPSKRARALIFAYTGTQKAMLWVGIVFSVFGSLLSLPFCWGLPVDLAIALTHRDLQGTVVDASLNRSAEIGGQHPTSITFTYEVNGRTYTGTCSTLDDQLVEAATPGARLGLEVARLNPAWARLAGTTHATFGYTVLITLIFPGIGLAFLTWAIRSNRREIRAYRRGTPILARVVYRGPNKSVKINGAHPFMVKWEFKIDDDIYEGSLSTMSLLAFEDLMEPSEVPVLYLPENPRINTLYIP